MTWLFGTFRNKMAKRRYYEYPHHGMGVFTPLLDYKIDKFTKRSEQILVHRENGYIYYAYVYRFSRKRYIGIAFRDTRVCDDNNQLLDLFRSAFQSLADEQLIVRETSSGEYKATGKKFQDCRVDLDIFLNGLGELNLDNIASHPLPTINLAVPANDITAQYDLDRYSIGQLIDMGFCNAVFNILHEKSRINEYVLPVIVALILGGLIYLISQIRV